MSIHADNFLPTFEVDGAIDAYWSGAIPESVTEPSVNSLARHLGGAGTTALIMVATTALYQPARGVFEHHSYVYYPILAGIFAAGAGEVATACYLTRSGQPPGQRLMAFARGLRLASVVPLIAAFAVGGFALTVKP